jgi:hypothetical protein
VAEALALHLVVELRVRGIDVDRKPALAPEVVERVLVSGLDVLAVHAEPAGEGA